MVLLFVAIYIESQDVSNLLEQYAKREGKNKTAALRELLQRELKSKPTKTAKSLCYDMLRFVEENPPKQRSKEFTKADFDALYEYLDAD